MLVEKTQVENKIGLHSRAAALFVQEAIKYKSAIEIKKIGDEIDAGKVYNAKSIMSILSMGAYQGDRLEIKIDGEDEELAMENLLNMLKYQLCELDEDL